MNTLSHENLSDGRVPKPAGPAVQWFTIGRGRLGLSPRPGSKTFHRLHEAGCTRLVTLLSAREGAPGVGRAAADHEMAWTWLPLPNGTPPTGEIAERFVHGLLQLREQIQAGESAVLHCAAGIHRTGMAAYTLLRLTGLDEDQALAAIAEMRTFTREGIQGRHIAFGNQVAQCQADWEQSAAQARPVPFPASYWVIPGKLLAGQYPGSPQPSDAEHKLRALAACGVQRVINLMEEQEVDHQSRPFVPYQEPLTVFGAESGQAMEFARYPIHDLWVPEPELMVLILDDIDRSMAAGKGVYVHCRGGIGRTGTVIGCYLARHGIAKGEFALRALAELRHRVLPWRDSPETDAQRALVSSWPVGR